MLTPISSLFLFFLISTALGAVIPPATLSVVEPRAYNLVQARTGGVRPEDVVRGGLFVVKTNSLYFEGAKGRPSCDKTVVVPMETPEPGKSTIEALYLTDHPDHDYREVLAEPYLLLDAPYAFQKYSGLISISDLQPAIPKFWWYDPSTLSALPDLFPPLLPAASGSQLDDVGSSHVPEEETSFPSKKNRGRVFTLKEDSISGEDAVRLSPYVGKQFFYLGNKASKTPTRKYIVSGVLMSPGSLPSIPDHVPANVFADRASKKTKAWLSTTTYLNHYFVQVTVYEDNLKRHHDSACDMTAKDAAILLKALNNPSSFNNDEEERYYGYSHRINKAANYHDLDGKILIPLPPKQHGFHSNAVVLVLSTTWEDGYVSAADIMKLIIAGESEAAETWRKKELSNTRAWWCKVMNIDKGYKQHLERISGQRDFHFAHTRLATIRDAKSS